MRREARRRRFGAISGNSTWVLALLSDGRCRQQTQTSYTCPNNIPYSVLQTKHPDPHAPSSWQDRKILSQNFQLNSQVPTQKKNTGRQKETAERERETHTYTQHQTRSMSNHRPQKRPITDQQTQKFPQGKNPQIACFLTPPRHRNVTLNMSICFPVYHNIYDPKPLMQESTRRPTRPLPPIDLAPAWYNRWKDPVR